MYTERSFSSATGLIGFYTHYFPYVFFFYGFCIRREEITCPYIHNKRLQGGGRTVTDGAIAKQISQCYFQNYVYPVVFTIQMFFFTSKILYILHIITMNFLLEPIKIPIYIDPNIFTVTPRDQSTNLYTIKFKKIQFCLNKLLIYADLVIYIVVLHPSRKTVISITRVHMQCIF